MSVVNIEIKARSKNQDKIREILIAKNADFKGTDHQIDTYFNVNVGRLKLREWTIENKLIHYQRENKEWPKQSDITLYKSEPNSSLKETLTKALGILVVVDKKREIYFIDNVKFHVDTVENLWTFVEIEATDETKPATKEQLLAQCNYYLSLFGISENDLISVSYSDLLLKK